MRVHTDSVVAYPQPEHSFAEFGIQFYLVRACVLKCIGQRLSRDPVGVLPDGRLQLSGRTLDKRTEGERSSAALCRGLICHELATYRCETLDDVAVRRIVVSIPATPHALRES